MDAESQAQLQHFTDVVYGQNDTTTAVPLSELAKIESRSVSFARWKTSVEESGQVPKVPEGLLRHWVNTDIASFRQLQDDVEVEIAADNIYANFQLYDAYCKEMEEQAKDVAKRVGELNEASRKRGEEQDRVSAKDLVARMRDTEAQRKLPENEDLVDGFASGGPRRDMKPADPIGVSRVLESITYKGQADGSVLYLLLDKAAFVDHGRQIVMDKQSLDNDEAILAAVLLAKEKYGGAFSLTGSEEFKRRALEVIAKNNIPIKLKSPAQEMMLIEVGEKYPNFTHIPSRPAARELIPEAENEIGSPEPAQSNEEPPEKGEAAARSVVYDVASGAEGQSSVVNDNAEIDPSEVAYEVRELKAIPAIDWWRGQAAIIRENIHDVSLRVELFMSLGPEPSEGTMHWFDRAGNYVANPSIEEMRSYEERKSASFSPVIGGEADVTHEDANSNQGEESMDSEKIDFEALEVSVIERLQAFDWEAEKPTPRSAVPNLDQGLYDDLERLSQHNFEKAAKAWEEHVPEGTPKPTYVDRKWKRAIEECRQMSDLLNESERVSELVEPANRDEASKAYEAAKANTDNACKLEAELYGESSRIRSELREGAKTGMDESEAQGLEFELADLELQRSVAEKKTRYLKLKEKFAELHTYRFAPNIKPDDLMALEGLIAEVQQQIVDYQPADVAKNVVVQSQEAPRAIETLHTDEQRTVSGEPVVAQDAKSLSSSHKGENNVAEQVSKSPVLRGVERNKETGKFEETVLLFKGKGDYLQGFIISGGEKHQVLAHINERKPDASTGEIKPNFLKLSKAEGQGDAVQWTELGFGNALNKRTDGKPVYFDEVLFNVGGKTISARLGKGVSEELHAKLGFASSRVERPKDEKKDAKEGPKSPAPQQQAPQQPDAPAAQESAATPQKRKPRTAAKA